MKQHGTIPAESGKSCDCCGRTHRKLYFTNGLWMGKSCTAWYKLYQRSDGKDVNSLIWKGYEKQYWKVARLYGVTK